MNSQRSTFDETPRQEMRRLLLGEVNRSIGLRELEIILRDAGE